MSEALVPEEQVKISVTINGRIYSDVIPARISLTDFIRERCGLTGTHLGCEQGVCGSCSVLLDGRSVRSCIIFAVQAAGSDIMTIEGLSAGQTLGPIQEAFWDQRALQCAFCTSGFLITTYELLRDNHNPTEDEILEALSGHICRCTGYETIVAAVWDAASRVRTSGMGETEE